MKRNELLKTEGYWIAKIQSELFQFIDEYMVKNNLNRTQVSEKLGFTKGYISQLLNGSFDHKLSKLIELSLAFDKVIVFKNFSDFVEDDTKERLEYENNVIQMISDYATSEINTSLQETHKECYA